MGQQLVNDILTMEKLKTMQKNQILLQFFSGLYFVSTGSTTSTRSNNIISLKTLTCKMCKKHNA